MENITERALSKLKEAPNIKKILVGGEKGNLSTQRNIIEDLELISKQKSANKNRTSKKKTQASSHTEADINWTPLVEKITGSNAVKFTATVGGAGIGSLVGAALLTGLGFATGGKGSATVGYYIGKFVGAGAGGIGAYKYSEFVVDKFDSGEKKDVVEKADTKIFVDTMTEIHAEKGGGENEFSF